MSPENLDSAAWAFLCRGEEALSQGDPLGFELFEKASQMKPCSADVFLRQGLSLVTYGSAPGREKALLLASRKLKIAAHLAPNNSSIWHTWGTVLLLLGTTLKEHRYFVEAEEKLKKALALAEGDKIFEIFHDLAKTWSHIANHSGEAIDLHKALEFFQKCAPKADSLATQFWSDYGSAYLTLGQLVCDPHLIESAIACFKQALCVTSFENWLMLAHGLQALFYHTHEEDHFVQADTAFATAAQFSPYNLDLLYEWALFRLEAGKAHQDMKKIHACIEKCRQSYILNVKQPLLMAVWAEALSLLGEMTDQVELLHEAQNKITEAEQLDDSLQVCHAHAQCLYSWGNYFEDLDFYCQAIEKFQEGLSSDRTRHQDWAAIAKVYLTIADIDDDITACEKAIRFYAKAIDLKPTSHSYFEYAYALSRLGEMNKQPELLRQSVRYFDYALQLQKNASYIYPTWLYNYGITLDYLGDRYEDEADLHKALELFFQVLMAEPDFPRIHYRIGVVYSHLGEATDDVDCFHHALHHLRLAYQHDDENDSALLEWGVALIHLAELSSDKEMAASYYQTAEFKLMQAARLGSQSVFYQLASLYSLLGQFEKAFEFIQKAYKAEVLPPVENIVEDEWLEPLRSTPLFQQFLAHLQHGPSRS
jgi:tetratricopeptide (TPR) repeat protein